MNILGDCINLYVDWSQFWPSMIATFAGFVLALLGQLFFEKMKSFVDSKELLKRLKVELNDICTTLKNLLPTDIDVQPLKTLVWDEAINVGQVSLLKATKRAILFKIYKQIQEFNSWCKIQTDFYFSHDSNLNEKLKQELIKQKNIMLDNSKSEDANKNISIPYVLSII